MNEFKPKCTLYPDHNGLWIGKVFIHELDGTYVSNSEKRVKRIVRIAYPNGVLFVRKTVRECLDCSLEFVDLDEFCINCGQILKKL